MQLDEPSTGAGGVGPHSQAHPRVQEAAAWGRPQSSAHHTPRSDENSMSQDATPQASPFPGFSLAHRACLMPTMWFQSRGVWGDSWPKKVCDTWLCFTPTVTFLGEHCFLHVKVSTEMQSVQGTFWDLTVAGEARSFRIQVCRKHSPRLKEGRWGGGSRDSGEEDLSSLGLGWPRGTLSLKALVDTQDRVHFSWTKLNFIGYLGL